jgi:DNA-directed RNA polymerase subunit RPC12/RpoP
MHSRHRQVIVMKKGIVFGALLLATGFVLWQMVAGEFSDPLTKVAMNKVQKEDFDWFTCPSCGKLFMAEATGKKGSCPYCGFTMMLGIEQKRVIGTSVDESEFVSFFSPKCKNLFFAYQTGQKGKCPYCGESIELTAPATIDLEESPPGLLVFAKAHAVIIFLMVIVLGGIAALSIYILMGRRVILSLQPLEGALSDKRKIEVLKRQIKKKQLTLGVSTSDDISINHPSLEDFHCTLSFVRVGGNTHAYLHRNANLPILVNDKPQYNAQLKDHDKVKLGDILFEVRASRNE